MRWCKISSLCANNIHPELKGCVYMSLGSYSCVQLCGWILKPADKARLPLEITGFLSKYWGAKRHEWVRKGYIGYQCFFTVPLVLWVFTVLPVQRNTRKSHRLGHSPNAPPQPTVKILPVNLVAVGEHQPPAKTLHLNIGIFPRPRPNSLFLHATPVRCLRLELPGPGSAFRLGCSRSCRAAPLHPRHRRRRRLRPVPRPPRQGGSAAFVGSV